MTSKEAISLAAERRVPISVVMVAEHCAQCCPQHRIECEAIGDRTSVTVWVPSLWPELHDDLRRVGFRLTEDGSFVWSDIPDHGIQKGDLLTTDASGSIRALKSGQQRSAFLGVCEQVNPDGTIMVSTVRGITDSGSMVVGPSAVVRLKP